MKFKIGQRVQIPNRFWVYCGSDKTAKVVKVDVKLVARQRSAQVI